MSGHDFSKVHGPSAPDPATFLRRENAELKNQLAAMNQEAMMRAAPRVGELIDSLNNLIGMARQGNPNARHALELFCRTLDGARDAGSVLTIVKNGSS